MVISASGTVSIAMVLGAAALIVIPERVHIPPVRAAGSGPKRTPRSARWRAAVAGSGVAAATLLLVPDRWWIAFIAAAITAALVGRHPARRSAGQRKVDRQVTAIHADLFAACLDAGMPVGPALRAASAAMTATGFSGGGPRDRGGTVRDGGRSVRGGRTAMLPQAVADHTVSADDSVLGRTSPYVEPRTVGAARSADSPPLAALEAVAAMLSLGANPDIAWRAADDVTELVTLAAAARRSAAGGARLADAVREHASLLRADQAASDLRAAGRAGVLMTAPLGICFLPAFLCLGLAPVIVGLLGQLDIF